MVGHGGRSAGSYLADPTSPIPSHCASIVTTSTVRVLIDDGQPAGNAGEEDHDPINSVSHATVERV